MRKRAFIIGNGISRAPVDLKSLKKFGEVYGCNAIYREFEPDWLVAIDPDMIDEILASGFPLSKVIIPPPDEQFEPAECNRYRPRSNAGMNAMLEAIKKGNQDLYCFGIDFIWKSPHSLSNVYDGTRNYGPETRATLEDNLNRIRYLEYVAYKNKTVNFFLVFPEQYFTDLEFNNINSLNIRGLTFSKFREIMNAQN